ncbi:MAG: hypothetical protein EX266_06655 [Rhodobacteraceae bacterium]|nr:MAG: hypothetical protein EX266_06655 [Paracoccaceae bacterium]
MGVRWRTRYDGRDRPQSKTTSTARL